MEDTYGGVLRELSEKYLDNIRRIIYIFLIQ